MEYWRQIPKYYELGLLAKFMLIFHESKWTNDKKIRYKVMGNRFYIIEDKNPEREVELVDGENHRVYTGQHIPKETCKVCGRK